ncbi:ribosome maturation factor RimP [Haloimpatiens sp. FM7330]|uniref:ribosome maturation factor RimP n=1 Tax=Haloimpatiens sp. FM7330 TaxID=3298610 RepID=UPI003639C54D
MKNENLIYKLKELIQPIVTDKGYELYYIEFIKEKGENFLRIYIDSSNGIGLDDCEKVSREVSNILDTEDPISCSYYLEVSSPGINRTLYTDEHLNKYIGETVKIKLYKLFNGSKKYIGKLKEFNDLEIKIEDDGEQIVIPREKISNVSLHGEM